MTTPYLIEEVAPAVGTNPDQVYEPTGRLIPKRATNEARDLRNRLWKNHALLAGEQMTPDEPRRWLPVLFEMTVQDISGASRWSADLVFVDQDAIVTIVECKRRADTRARREVIGQVFEYVANAGHLWSAEKIRMHASESAISRGLTLEGEMQRLGLTAAETVDEFFSEVGENIKARRMRVVFYLDQCPQELKPLVKFWNEEMRTVQAHIVELREYDVGSHRIVIPVLLGYTDEGERIAQKSNSGTETTGTRSTWNEESFFVRLAASVTAEQLAAAHNLFEFVKDNAELDVSWGTGKTTGSFNIRLPLLAPKSLISIYSTGTGTLNLGWLNSSDTQIDLRNRLFEFARAEFGLQLSDDAKDAFPRLPLEIWVPNVGAIKSWLLEQIKRSV